MNRRDLLVAVSTLLLPVKSVFGNIFNKKSIKWPNGYDFEFEGTKCKFYIWPKDKMIVFHDGTDEYNTIMAPTFDLRDVGISLEENIRMAIESCKSIEEYNRPFCSIVQYEKCDSQFSIICFPTERWVPKTSFIPMKGIEKD